MAELSRFCRALIPLVVGTVLALPLTARAEYLLGRGDVIELSAAGLPDLRQRARIDSNGEISLPFIGQLVAAGRPLSELRAEVRQRLPEKPIRRRTPQGLDVVVVDPDEIVLEIAEYRPIYVNGDVARPGEQPYRLGMTIRHAIALAGGYDLIRFRADANPIAQSADLRSEYLHLWTEFAQAQTQTWRIEGELSGKASLAPSEKQLQELRELPVPSSVVAQILRFESDKLTMSRAVLQKDKSSLNRLIAQSDEQSALINEQLEKTKQGMQLAMAELARAQSLFERGLTPAQKVAEERRLTLLSQTQHLLTTERLGQVKKDREEFVRKLEVVDEQRRTALSQELQDANMRLASVKTRLQAVDEKLTFAGLLKSQLTRGKGASPDLVIHRSSERGREQIPATEDAEMLPGDTVDVSLRSDAGLAAAGRE